jgi:hypothetical protein
MDVFKWAFSFGIACNKKSPEPCLGLLKLRIFKLYHVFLDFDINRFLQIFDPLLSQLLHFHIECF